MLHLRDATLNRFVDGELETRDRQRVAQHLASCARCRSSIGEIRRLLDRASELPDPDVSRDLLWRVLHATTEGHGAILPKPDGFRSVRRPSRAQVAKRTVVVAAAMFVLVIVSAPEILSEASSLRFSPGRAGIADKVRVRYAATPTNWSSDSVLLRAEVFRSGRSAWDKSREYIIVDTLVRSRKTGDFHGEFHWPDGVLVANFGVESLDGQWVDRNRRFDEPLLLHDNGKPTLSALTEQFREYFNHGRRESLLRVAQQMTRYYPNEPSAWSAEHAAAVGEWGARVADSVFAEQWPFFSRLANDSSRYDSPDWLAEMFGWVFSAGGNEQLVSHWRDLVLSRAPNTQYAIQIRTSDIEQRAIDNSATELLREYDVLWHMVGPHDQIAAAAYTTAIHGHDGTEVGKWAERYIGFRPWARVSVARDIMKFPEARPVAISQLQTALTELQGGRLLQRPLHKTVIEHGASEAAQQRRIATLLGRALYAEGQVLAAISFIEQAIHTGWDVDAFLLGSTIRLEMGDSARAAEFLARTYVDNAATGNPTGRMNELGLRLAPKHWEQYKIRADARMFDHVMNEASTLPIDGDSVFVTNQDGRAENISHVLGTGLAVVAFAWWDQSHAIDSLVRLAEDLAGTETRMIVITNEFSTSAYREVIRATPSLAWYHDLDAMALRYLSSERTPDLYVIDAKYNRVFRSSTFAEVPRQIAMLQRSWAVNAQAMVAP